MAAIRKPLDLRSWASDRKLTELSKTMDLEEIAKTIGRKPEAIRKRANRLGISLKSASRANAKWR